MKRQPRSANLHSRPSQSHSISRCFWLGLVAGVGLGSSARAQVDWSGQNRPVHDGVVETGQAVVFTYQVYDQGRTEGAGRGTGLGAALLFRDADGSAPFSTIAMTYAGQAGIGGNDDVFSVTVPAALFEPATRVEYFTVAYDSLAAPVHADTTRQDANGRAPNFVFTFGQALMPHNVYVHFSICLNGRSAGATSVVVDPRNGSTVFEVGLTRVAPSQIPDLWEADVLLRTGVAQTIAYRYRRDGVAETDALGQPIEHRLTMTVGSFLQGQGTDTWGGEPLGCHLQETLTAPLSVHFSVCLAGQSYSGVACVSGNTPELGSFETPIPLVELQPGTDLFEGDIAFPAGSPAVVQFKFQKNDCADWEDLFNGSNQTTNRFLYLGGAASPYVAPTATWQNVGPNFCPAPLGVESTTWTRLKTLFR